MGTIFYFFIFTEPLNPLSPVKNLWSRASQNYGQQGPYIHFINELFLLQKNNWGI